MKFVKSFGLGQFSGQADCVEISIVIKFWNEICINFGLGRFSGRLDCVEISILYKNEKKIVKYSISR